MNFFRRRKILRQANFLELHPLRLLKERPVDDGTLVLLLPRFKNESLGRIFASGQRKKHIEIRLDRFGSAVWRLINGSSDVFSICRQLQQMFPDELIQPGETEERTTRFLSMLYHERYITFTEIEGHSAAGVE